MFGVVYRFRVRAGSEAAFEAAWAAATRSIVERAGGLGSRLHRAGEGRYFAVAQWPDEATWRAFYAGPAVDPEASDAMGAALEPGPSVEVLAAGEVVADLFAPPA